MSFLSPKVIDTAMMKKSFKYFIKDYGTEEAVNLVTELKSTVELISDKHFEQVAYGINYGNEVVGSN